MKLKSTVCKQANSIDVFFTTGLILLLSIGLPFLIGVPLMYMGVSLTPYHFPVSLLLSVLAGWYIAPKGTFLKSVGLSALVIVIGLWTGSLTCDVTFDSYYYHFDIVQRLALEHWNPYLGINIPEGSPVWTLHYPKYAEWTEACIYSTFDNINLATGYLYILLAATACFGFSVLRNSCTSVNPLVLIGIVAVMIANPVGLSQLATGCNDSLIYYFLCLTILFTVNIWHDRNRVVNYVLLCVTIVLAINTKNNALFFEFLEVIAILTGWYIFRRTIELKSYLIICFIAGAAGFCLWGFHPFITNWITEGNPIFPHSQAAYQELIDVTEGYEVLRGHNQFVNFFISICQSSVPSSQPGLGGFGKLFPIILGISFCVFVWTMVANRSFSIYHYTYIVIFGSVFIFVASWNARFNPQLWLLMPCTMLILLHFYPSSFKARLLLWVIFALTMVNDFSIFKYNFLLKWHNRIEREAIYKAYKNDTIRIKYPTGIIRKEFAAQGITVKDITCEVDSINRVDLGGITHIDADSLRRELIFKTAE